MIYCETEYGSEEGNKLVDKVFETIATTAYRASVELAKEKGSFPFLIGSKQMKKRMSLRSDSHNTGFMKKMPEDIRESILENGIRNSHLLTVAPTGRLEQWLEYQQVLNHISPSHISEAAV